MSENPLDRIQSYYDDLTKTDREIALFIINNPVDAARVNIGTLARETKASKSAIVRFCNKIGYSGFAEFRFDLSRFLVSRNSLTRTDEQTQTDPVKAITETYASYISMIADSVTAEDMKKTAELITGSRRIKIYGMNRTFNAANQLKQRLSKIGIDSEASCDTAIMGDQAEYLNKDDLVIIFTIRNNMNNFTDIVRSLNDNHVPVICITMSQALSFKKKCAQYLVLPRISKDSGISFLDDQAIFFVLIELILDAAAVRLRSGS